MTLDLTEETKRGKVSADLHAGRSPLAIAEFNELPLSFVYQIKRKLQVPEHPVDIDIIRGKPVPCSVTVTVTVMIPDFVARVQKMVDQELSKSIRSSGGASKQACKR